MKLHIQLAWLHLALFTASGNANVSRTTTSICLQSIALPSAPFIPLAEIKYDPRTLSAEFGSFDAPELSSEATLVRIGICDAATQVWKSSTSVTSAESFNKGYAPIIVLSLNTRGDIVGVTCKSVRVDAGQTRDFGPKVKVVKMTTGKRPELNRPIVVSKEGTEDGELPEKTLLQKFVIPKLNSNRYLTILLQILVGGCRRDGAVISYRRGR
jgi:hypothetical protein